MNKDMNRETEQSLQPKKKRKKHTGRKATHLLGVFLLAALNTAKYVVLLGMIGLLALLIKYLPALKTDYEDAVRTVAASDQNTFNPDMASTIYDSSGEVIAKLSNDNKRYQYLEYKDIPSNAVNAFVAIEDQSFWDNSGYDPLGVAHSVFRFIQTRGKMLSGASTITQQICKLTFLNADRTVTRKAKEVMYADRMTKTYSKQAIMEYYINNCCFANSIYGIEEAAQEYFGVSAKELTLSQTAYLCAIPNRPGYYDPWKNPNNALKRRDKILKDMCECGYITAAQRDEALKETITVRAKGSVQEAEEGDESSHTQGTTQDYQTTYAVKCATEYLMELNGFSFKYAFDTAEEYQQYRSDYNEAYQTAKNALYTQRYSIYTSLNTTAQNDLQNMLDEALKNRNEKSDSGSYALQGSMTVIDNESGKVVAIIGGRSQEGITTDGSLNRAFQSYRQPGSTFKPILVYAPAIESGDYNADSELKDISVDAAKKSNKKISEMSGASITLRNAVVRSRNGAAYWLANAIGIDYGMKFIDKMGFSRVVPADHTLAAALGGLTNGTNTLEMASAYGVFTNNGNYTLPSCILSMQNMNKMEIYKDPTEVKVFSSTTMSTMEDIMSGVFSGSGTAASTGWSNTDIDAAGKTGTTNDSKDAWFTGYTPYYTISVWTGFDDNRSTSYLYGYSYPVKIWKSAMEYMIDGKEPAHFSE